MSKAVVFPGQGSQSVGMLSQFNTLGSNISARLTEASDLIHIDLSSIVALGPQERLDETEITQPAILAVSVGLFELLQENSSIEFSAAAGHSLGEYTALTIAGAIEFQEVVRLVHQRGVLMQQAVPKGSGKMVAVVGLDDVVLKEICTSTTGVVFPANYNSPGQTVVAGKSKSVDAASEKFIKAGAKRVVPLPVSIPSHCPLMESITPQFETVLHQVNVRSPSLPIYQNVNAASTIEPKLIRENLVTQLSRPVQWRQLVERMAQDGLEEFYECGPGKVLTGLFRRIDRKLPAIPLGDLTIFNRTIEARA